MSEEEVGLVFEESFEGVSFDELLRIPQRPRIGTIIDVPVIEVLSDKVIVDVGLKSEGIIDREEFRNREIRVGEHIPVLIQELENETGHPSVSYRQAQRYRSWENLATAFNKNISTEGKIIRKVKGGYLVDVGEESFLPISQVLTRYKNQSPLNEGDSVWIKIIELDRRKRNIIVSQKRCWEDEMKKKREELQDKLREGEVLSGVVSGITSFGAFVDLGGVEGLIHISDLSWRRVDKVDDIVKVDQQVKVKISKYDPKTNKISLSLKDLTPHPWENIGGKYTVGKSFTGTVTSLTPFGAFVQLEPGIEGLLHISELSWTVNVKSPQEILAVNQKVEVYILNIDREKQKISLSLKRLSPNPWEEVKNKYSVNSKVTGEVTSLAPFGAFVRLPEGIEGLIHISDFSWTKRIRHPQEVLHIGQMVEAVVLEVNVENEKVLLGIKQLTEDPYQRYQPGVTVEGKVKRITEYAVFVELEQEMEGVIRLNELSMEKVEDPGKIVKEGMWVKAKVIKGETTERDRRILLSIRKYEKEKETEDIKKYINQGEERITLGEIVQTKDGE